MRESIFHLFKDKLSLDVPSADTDLLEAGLLDSLMFVELTYQIEKQFGVTIPIHKIEIEQFRSVSCIANYVAHHRPR
jgi:acyl carrier protein